MSQDVELERQIGCVIMKLRSLCQNKTKGSLTVHLDGSGYLGKQIEVHSFEWRDNYSDVSGRKMSDDEFNQIIEQQSSQKRRN
jgi:hypothetical protein